MAIPVNEAQRRCILEAFLLQVIIVPDSLSVGSRIQLAALHGDELRRGSLCCGKRRLHLCREIMDDTRSGEALSAWCYENLSCGVFVGSMGILYVAKIQSLTEI
jgi:hypothetical protein